jgi:general secretion pathway protein D
MRAIVDKTARPAMEPALAQALQKTVSIDFKDASVKQVFDVLAKAAGINIVLDRDVKSDQRMTLSLREIPVKDAIEIATLTNQLEQRVVGRNAVLVYPNTAAKQKDYEELSVHTFFLANADPEQVSGALKSVLKMRDVVVDKSQNAVIVRDTPAALRMAEKVVEIEDLPTPETMIEVEVLEVNRDRMSDLGIKFPPSLSLSPLPSTSGGALTLYDLRHPHLGTIGATLDPLVINAHGTDSDIKTLANPRIRVRNRETAKILIGDRVPNITSTATSTGFVSENVQYLDVGLKVELTPTITIDNEVAIKVSLEVSSIAKQITTSAGTTAYQIGTRSASTVLRLKDGENQILAGLINNQDSRTFDKVPGLGDVPGLGHIFGNDSSDKSGDEIVLSITPRLVRNTPRPDAALSEFASGTDSALRGADGADFGMAAAPSVRPAPVPASTAPPTPRTAPAASASSSADAPEGRAPASDAAAAANASLSGTGGSSSSSGPVGVSASPAAWIANWGGPATAAPGTALQQQLRLTAPQPLTGLSLTIGFDPAAFQMTDVLEGTLLRSDGTATTFTQHVDAATGQVRIAITRPSGAAPMPPGQGSVVVLDMKPLASGISSSLRVLSMTATAADGSVVEVPLPADQLLTVSGKTPSP